MKTVTVIDYGMSNLRSVSKALEHVAGKDWRVQVSDKVDVIQKSDKVVFPGQGAIGNCMTLLKKKGLDDAIMRSLERTPFLGICLGLQTLLTTSEESGGTAGFNWIYGTVRRFNQKRLGEHFKIPHMGWNQVQQNFWHPLWLNIPEKSRFYFVHSYYVNPGNSSIIAGNTDYGNFNFTAVVARGNVFAVQFHPEKSQKVGLTLLKNFLNW